MSDLVARLRESDEASALTNEAARRIEALEAQLAESDALADAIERDVWENTQTWFSLTAYRKARGQP